MKEYKIIQGSISECQKKLNQWKHEFELVIFQMCVVAREVTILLLRTKKQ